MIEHLPPDSAWHRHRRETPWADSEWMLHDISSRLRDLNVLIGNVFRGKGAPAAPPPKHLPHPRPAGLPDPAAQAVPGEPAVEAELLSVVHRKG